MRELALIGERMNFPFRYVNTRAQWTAAAILLLQTLAWAGGSQPVWTINLEKYGLRPFHTQMDLTWTRQQNVLFLPSGRLLVYQVNQLAEPAQLATRNTSGGAGNFFLEIRVFDVRDGHLLQSLKLPANGGFSSIARTQDGKLIVRTGESLRLVTPEFQTLASRTLPIERQAPIEDWQIGVSPSGAQIALVHEQATPSPAVISDEKALSQVEILDAATLKTVKQFTVPKRLSPWSAGDGFLIAADLASVTGALRFGRLDFDGNWSALTVNGDRCNYHFSVLDGASMAVYGCGRLAVVNAGGVKLFSHDVNPHSLIGSVSRSGRYLAMELDREEFITIPGANFPFMAPRPERLEWYDLDRNRQLLSRAVKSDNLYYSISDHALAVIEGSRLTLYHTEE